MTDTSEPRTDRRTVVLAGTYQQFRYWCIDNGRNPHDRLLTYASEAYKLRGMRDFDFVIYGTFWARRDAEEIVWMAKTYSERR